MTRSLLAQEHNTLRIQRGLKPHYHECKGCSRLFDVQYPSYPKWWCDFCEPAREAAKLKNLEHPYSVRVLYLIRARKALVPQKRTSRPKPKPKRSSSAIKLAKIHGFGNLKKSEYRAFARSYNNQYGAEPELNGKMVFSHNTLGRPSLRFISGNSFTSLSERGSLSTTPFTYHPLATYPAAFQSRPECNQYLSVYEHKFAHKLRTHCPNLKCVYGEEMNPEDFNDAWLPGVVAFSPQVVAKLPDFYFPTENAFVEIASLQYYLKKLIHASSGKPYPGKARELFNNAYRGLFSAAVKVLERQDIWKHVDSNRHFFLATDLVKSDFFSEVLRESSSSKELFEKFAKFSREYRQDLFILLRILAPDYTDKLLDTFGFYSEALASGDNPVPDSLQLLSSDLASTLAIAKTELMSTLPSDSKTLIHHAWRSFCKRRSSVESDLLELETQWKARFHGRNEAADQAKKVFYEKN